MQALDRIRRVNHRADRRREGEQRNDVLPRSAPSLADCRVAPAPLSLECVELGERALGRLGPIDGFQIGHDDLAVLPRYEGQRVADQMDDAGFAQWSAERLCRSPPETP